MQLQKRKKTFYKLAKFICAASQRRGSGHSSLAAAAGAARKEKPAKPRANCIYRVYIYIGESE